ncbi:MAG TPA: tetratricopeptide repeat protein [Chthoniobacterales bacterium]
MNDEARMTNDEWRWNAPGSSLSVERWTLSVGRLLPEPLLFLILFIFLFVPRTHAQTITLTTGQKIETQGVRRDGDLVLGKVQIGTGSGEVGYHIPQITKVDFPEPAALKAASDFLVQGQPDKALGEINPVITYYGPFRDVPGNWWAQAALIKVSILAAQQHETEAEALASEIEKGVKDPEMARAAQLRLVGALLRKMEYEKAIAICDGALKASTDPTTLANAWIAKGDALFAQKEWSDALMAYLHVPVFYPDEKLFQPAALLGSGKTYRRLNDMGRAKKSLNELIGAFPQSAEATAAQTELKKL